VHRAAVVTKNGKDDDVNKHPGKGHDDGHANNGHANNGHAKKASADNGRHCARRG
jgi:hypothetical protein